MDHKQLRRTLVDETGRSAADIDALIEGLTMLIGQAAADLDAVAVPSFGTFTPVKHEEEIRTDLSTGRRLLLPPQITLEFTPAAALMRKLSPTQDII